MLLTFVEQTELVEFAGEVELVVVCFDGFKISGHEVLIFEEKCHG